MKAVALAACILALACGARADDPLVAKVRRTGAAVFDSTLPTVFTDAWLAGALPQGATIAWETNDCGEQTGDPALDAGRTFPTCVAALIDVPSRARRITLLFEPETPAFVLGVLTSPEAHGDMYFEELGLVPAMLGQVLALRPIMCPEGTEPRTETAYAGSTESCARGAVADGPFRSWFSTGLYLMEAGAYAGGAKSGRWIECDRFERCVNKDY